MKPLNSNIFYLNFINESHRNGIIYLRKMSPPLSTACNHMVHMIYNRIRNNIVHIMKRGLE